MPARWSSLPSVSRAILLVVSLLLCPAAADWRQKNTYCVWGCYDSLIYVDFADTSETEDYYVGQCTSDNFTRSLYYCAESYCSLYHVRKGIASIDRLCQENAAIALPKYDDIIDALPYNSIPGVERVSYPAVLRDAPFDHPVIPDQAFYDVAYRSNAGFYNNVNLSMEFAWASYGYWALIVAIGMLNRLYWMFARQSRSRPGTFSRLVRRQVVLPATFRTQCQQPLWQVCTIPPRIETLVIFLYVAMNFIFCFPGYGLFKGDLNGDTQLQLVRYLSDRTGVLAVANLPIIWVFAARNDPFLWLTGWSFTTFNHFHRWVARLTIVLSIVHSIVYTVFFFDSGTASYYENWKEPYFYAGVLGTIFISLMLAFSVYTLRAYFYDLFLVIHICLAVGTLVAIYYHLKLCEGHYLVQWVHFIWPCVAMWGFDRLLRFGRVFFHGAKSTTARVAYEQDSEIIRLDVSETFRFKNRVPGQYYFVYAPSSLRGYESHPFTLCSWPAKANDTRSEVESKEKISSRVRENGVARYETSHTFLLRPYAGFTRRLRDKTHPSKDSESQTNSTELSVLLEGPYGISRNLHLYTDILFIAGGSGITPAISYTHHLLSARNPPNIHIVWALRQLALAESVGANELCAARGNVKFMMDVYVTGSGKGKRPVKVEEEALYTVHERRPDIEGCVRRAREECKGSLAVAFCGPRGLSDECRRAVVGVLKEEGPDVGLFNETLTW